VTISCITISEVIVSAMSIILLGALSGIAFHAYERLPHKFIGVDRLEIEFKSDLCTLIL